MADLCRLKLRERAPGGWPASWLAALERCCTLALVGLEHEVRC
jgi:hypothetical protein